MAQVKKIAEGLSTGAGSQDERKGLNLLRLDRFKYRIILPLVLAAVALAIYGPSLRGGFVYDDQKVVEDNDFIRDIRNLPTLLSQDYFSRSGELSYRPVVTLSYFIDFQLWGLRSFGFRLTNLLIHFLAAISIAFLARRLGLSSLASFIAGLIFLAHPASVEPVALVSYREDLFAALFLIFSLAFQFRYRWGKFHSQAPVSGRTGWLISSILAYGAALFSKESALVLLPILSLHDLIFWRRAPKGVKPGKIFSGYAPYIVLSAFYLGVRFFLMHNPAEQKLEYFGGSILSAISLMPKVILLYAKTILLPSNLNADYDLAISAALPSIAFALAVFLILAGVLIFCKGQMRREPAICFGILWLFAALGPVLNLYPLANAAAERYLYIPIAGFTIALAGGFDKALRRRRTSPRPILNKSLPLAIALILVFLLYGLISHKRSQVWRAGISLWSDTVKKSPLKARPHNNYANAMLQLHNYDKSAYGYQMALFLDDSYSAAYNNLGLIFQMRGYNDIATFSFARARPWDYGNWKAANNLGLALAKRNSFAPAAAQFKMAAAINPRAGEAYYNLGAAFEKMGRLDKSVIFFHMAMRLKPNDPMPRYAIGVIFLQNLKLPAKALFYFNKALDLKPDPEMEAVLRAAVAASQKAMKN